MQISTIDRIGHTPPAIVKAYGVRAIASNQSMNIPFDVSESSSTEGKRSWQDLPIEACKVDGVEGGRRLTAPAGLTQALEKLSQRSEKRPDAEASLLTMREFRKTETALWQGFLPCCLRHPMRPVWKSPFNDAYIKD